MTGIGKAGVCHLAVGLRFQFAQRMNADFLVWYGLKDVSENLTVGEQDPGPRGAGNQPGRVNNGARFRVDLFLR